MSDETKINAILVTMQNQRNNALNSLAQLQGEMAVVNATVIELKKQLDTANAALAEMRALPKEDLKCSA